MLMIIRTVSEIQATRIGNGTEETPILQTILVAEAVQDGALMAQTAQEALVIPVTDTLKTLERASDGTLRTSSSPDPDRGRTFAAQTPQMFLSEEIRAAYTLPYNTAFTDDASVARKYGIPLSYIIGERHNLKLTVPEDMEEARRILFSGRLCR